MKFDEFSLKIKMFEVILWLKTLIYCFYLYPQIYNNNVLFSGHLKCRARCYSLSLHLKHLHGIWDVKNFWNHTLKLLTHEILTLKFENLASINKLYIYIYQSVWFI